MKAKDVRVGAVYLVSVSGKLTEVRVVQPSPYGGWNGKNLQTGRAVRIRTARRLLRETSERSHP